MCWCALYSTMGNVLQNLASSDVKNVLQSAPDCNTFFTSSVISRYVSYILRCFQDLVLIHPTLISSSSNRAVFKRIIKGCVWRKYAHVRDYTYTADWVTWHRKGQTNSLSVCVFLCCDPSRAAIAGALYRCWKYVEGQNVGHWTAWTSRCVRPSRQRIGHNCRGLTFAEEDTVGKPITKNEVTCFENRLQRLKNVILSNVWGMILQTC